MQQYTTQHSLNNLVICMKNAYLWLAIKFEIEFQESIWFVFARNIVTQSKLFERFIYKISQTEFLRNQKLCGYYI